ncbi:hypothetical protein C8J57DRAFT_1721359, partial [Mycena rebaudengoi]
LHTRLKLRQDWSYARAKDYRKGRPHCIYHTTGGHLGISLFLILPFDPSYPASPPDGGVCLPPCTESRRSRAVDVALSWRDSDGGPFRNDSFADTCPQCT